MWFIDVLKLRPQTTSTFHLWWASGAPWPSTTRQPFLSSTVTRSPISVPKDPLHSFPLEKTFSSASLIKFDEILKFYSEANYPQPALNALRSLSHQRGTAECKTEAPHQKTSRFSCFLWDKIKKKLFSNGVLTLSIIEFRCDDLGEIWNVNCFVEICAMIGSSWQRKWNPATKMQRQFSFFKYV